MPEEHSIQFAPLLVGLPDSLSEERFETLLTTAAFRLERILSFGHSTPEGQWYDQDWDEWVVLLQGQACLTIEGRNDPVILAAGDSLSLPAHCRHRVDWTEPGRITVWLALHYAFRQSDRNHEECGGD
jgi:cupin 2 domain-containing protein